MALPWAASAQTTLSTQLANDGTYKNDLYWINFDGVTAANLTALANYQAVISNGTGNYGLSFALQAVGSGFVNPRALATNPLTSLGQPGHYSQSSGTFVIPTSGTPADGTLNFTNIEVRNQANQRLQFQWIVADAERTSGNGERIDGTTNGDGWALLEMLPGTTAGAPLNELTFGASTFSITPTLAGTSINAFLVSTKIHDVANPGAISILLTEPNGAQAVALAVQPLIPQASIACVQPRINTGETSICTVTVDNPPLDNFTIPVTVPTGPDYTSNCGKTFNFTGSGNTSVSQTCTVTVPAGTTPTPTTVPLTITPSPAGNYVVKKDGQVLLGAAAAAAVPTLNEWALMLLGLAMLGVAGFHYKRRV